MSVLYNVEEEKKYVYAKKITCTNCEGQFEDLRILNSKLRRKEPDMIRAGGDGNPRVGTWGG